MNLKEKQSRYKKSYFKLFSAVCDTTELIEKLIPQLNEDTETAKLLSVQAARLKAVQQQTEEIIISD